MNSPDHLEALVAALTSERSILEYMDAAIASGNHRVIADAQIVVARARSYIAIADLQSQAQAMGMYDGA